MLLYIVTSKFDFNKFGLILSKYSYKVKTNDILAGIIIGIESNYALVDLGLEQVCFLPLKEISISPISSPTDLLNVNYIGEFLILDINKNSNRIIVSMKRVQSIYLWNRLRQIDFSNITIYAKFSKSLTKGKLIIFNGLFFFVLNINIPKYYLRIKNKNLFMPFKFLEVKDYFHIAHVSSKLAVFNKVNKNLVSGPTYLGNVTSIKYFGVFVNILGVNCLLHISEILKKKNQIENLSSLYKLGDQIPLKIISKDIERGRVSVALKD
nr:30S ribosomal protein S1 [Scytosiphon promiscuus]QDM58427.1 30S ribosomal protein S1 [Scytosiphon promiscuus]QDM58570.1 30S ribosomal protein S1 [Scytosiphon promiscuus]QTW91476.1 ribosomal protein S1 [Scytosiphon lomentaria]WAM64664.1 30S ribosomal protein S1 [Scytosiphon lomentaria]